MTRLAPEARIMRWTRKSFGKFRKDAIDFAARGA